MTQGLARRRVLRWLGAAALMMGAITARRAQAQAIHTYELHLVLAFDVSASVNDVEFALQRAGTASALRHPSVQNAITRAPGGIAVSLVLWSSIRQQAIGLDWVTLRSAQDVARYADQVAAMPRRLPGGGTMIHAGLAFAAAQFDTAPGVARRRVIDLSANGRADEHDEMLAMRDRLVQGGVTINALAVQEDLNDLAQYFNSALIGGPGSFVITANDHQDFADAMRIKLFREINGALYSAAPAAMLR